MVIPRTDPRLWGRRPTVIPLADPWLWDRLTVEGPIPASRPKLVLAGINRPSGGLGLLFERVKFILLAKFTAKTELCQVRDCFPYLEVKNQRGQYANPNGNYRHKCNPLPTNIIQKLSTTNVINSFLLNRFPL